MKQKLFFVPAIIIAHALNAYTVINIDKKHDIYFSNIQLYFKRQKTSDPLIGSDMTELVKPGETSQRVPGFATRRVTFFIAKDAEKYGENTLEFSDRPTTDKILKDDKTTISMYFDAGTEKVEYKVVWEQDGKKHVRTSDGFHEIHKAVRRAPTQSMTDVERKESVIVPEQRGLRKILGEYLSGELTPKQERELQEELAKEATMQTLPAAPGGPASQ